jgi:acetyl esterase/lipase
VKYEKIYLEDHFKGLPEQKEKTPLTLYIPDVWGEINTEVMYPCAVICPGGGYWWTSEREAEPVALRLAGNGIAAAVVNYTCGGVHYPVQLMQILASVAYIRMNSKRLSIDPDRIAVMGFSAGGHAACSAGLFWQESEWAERLGVDTPTVKPNGMVLCYPVITSGEYAHKDSFKCLLGDDPDPVLYEKMSLEKQVTENAPKAFIWHTAEDGLVPVQSSLLISSALSEKNIPVELHIYPIGHHGMSLCDETVNKPEDVTAGAKYCAEWVGHAVKWIKEIL